MMEICIERFAESLDERNNMFDAFNKSLPNALLDAAFFFGDYMAFLNYFREIELKFNEKFLEEIRFSNVIALIFGINCIKQKGHYLNEVMTLQLFKKLDNVLMSIYPTIINNLVVVYDVIMPPD